MPQSLANVRVLDISTSASGAWCSRLLADLGADVTVFEPPTGHPLRQEPPFDSDGNSIAASYFLANKRGAVLDFELEHARVELRRSAATADVLVSNQRASQIEAFGLGYERLENDRLVLCHLTPFGMTGARAEQPANELTIAALSGWAALNGEASRSPLKPVGHQVAFCAGTAAAATIVAALIARDSNGEGLGEGQEIDIAELDVMVSAGSPAVLRGQYTGRPVPRREGTDITTGPVPVADGHFALTISRAHFWRDAMNVLGLPDLAEDPRWEASWYRQANKHEYTGRVGEAMAAWNKADLFEELAARRVVAGPVLTMAELAANVHLRERGFWTEVDGKVFPGAPFKMSATPLAMRSAAPMFGSDTGDAE